MVTTTIVHQRIQQQRLSQRSLSSPEAVVTWMGAMQAQDYAGAQWSLCLRMQGDTTATRIEEAFAAGTILRTHVLRPTWHFVTPNDIRWMLELTAPRVRMHLAYYDRKLEIDEQLVQHSNHVLSTALEGRQYQTRTELAAALAKAGVVAEGQRLAHIIMHAELHGVICSGPRRGKQFTYALLDERAPYTRGLSRDEALAELTRRYYTAHGPATVQDFVWWSGLTMADAKAGLALVADELYPQESNGQTYYLAASHTFAEGFGHDALLLPTYDELLVGYSGFDQARRGGQDMHHLVFDSTIVIDGLVVGSWRRTIKQRKAIIEIAPFRPLSRAHYEAISAASIRYGAFVGVPVQLVDVLSENMSEADTGIGKTQ